MVFAAPRDDLGKMREQMLAMTAQLNENCSATLIWSDRDDKSGEVETLFLTAKHCVKGSKKDMTIDIPVYQDNRIVKKERYIARVKGEYYKGDLALVELKDKQTFFDAVARIAPEGSPLVMGEEVWTAGYPLGFSLTITKGIFGSYETHDFPKDGIEYIRVTADATFGNSGGAMFHRNAAGDFELLGVTTARMRDNTFMGLYTPIDTIHDYLKVAVPAMYADDDDPPKTVRH